MREHDELHKLQGKYYAVYRHTEGSTSCMFSGADIGIFGVVVLVKWGHLICIV